MMPMQCMNCKNYSNEFKCDAFPQRIPDDIFTGEFDHTEKHPDQDNDILFEVIE